MNIWQNLKALTKSSTDSWIGGVCGGLGKATPLASWMWRALFLFFALAFGLGLVLYLVLWICVPSSELESEPANAASPR